LSWRGADGLGGHVRRIRAVPVVFTSQEVIAAAEAAAPVAALEVRAR